MKTNYDLYIEEKLRNNPKLRIEVWWISLKIEILQKVYNISPRLFYKITGEK